MTTKQKEALTIQNKDGELQYTVRSKGKREGAALDNEGPGGPDITTKSEPRSSVTG